MVTTPPSDAPDDTFALPGSSLAGIKKILEAYGTRRSAMAIGDVATALNTDKSSVSRNSLFLLGTELLSPGATRTLTAEGREMVTAMSIDDHETVRECWSRIVSRTPFLRDRLATLTLKGPMSRAKFTRLILETSGRSKTAATRAGARAVVDLLIEAGRIQDDAGSLTVVPAEEPNPESTVTSGPSVSDDSPSERETDTGGASARVPVSGSTPILSSPPTIAINIQLHIPETRDDEVYQNLFRALREELLQHRKE